MHIRTGSIEKLKTAIGHPEIIVSLNYLRGLDIAELKEEDMKKPSEKEGYVFTIYQALFVYYF